MPLKADHISHTYLKGTPFECRAVHDVNFEIQDGEFVGLIGHTGCGKSTLVQHLNGLLQPESGAVIVDGVAMAKENMQEMRRKVGLVFQYPEYQLFEETVEKDIAFGLKKENLSEEETAIRVREAAEIVGLDLSLLSESIYDLSGGQKRRAAIAGVIVMKPRFLILDEPAAGLDPAGRDDILQFARTLCDEQGISVILVSHSMEDIARMADRVLVMNKGSIVLSGKAADVFGQEEYLRSIGLSVPQITTLFSQLHQWNPAIRRDIFTVEQAAEEILRFREGGPV